MFELCKRNDNATPQKQRAYFVLIQNIASLTDKKKSK